MEPEPTGTVRTNPRHTSSQAATAEECLAGNSTINHDYSGWKLGITSPFSVLDQLASDGCKESLDRATTSTVG